MMIILLIIIDTPLLISLKRGLGSEPPLLIDYAAAIDYIIDITPLMTFTDAAIAITLITPLLIFHAAAMPLLTLSLFCIIDYFRHFSLLIFHYAFITPLPLLILY
jgi:hypothetical protein